jgi:hypothetical protein
MFVAIDTEGQPTLNVALLVKDAAAIAQMAGRRMSGTYPST